MILSMKFNTNFPAGNAEVVNRKFDCKLNASVSDGKIR